MSKKHRHRPVSNPHRHPHRDDDLLIGIRKTLQDDHPLALLVSASQYLEISTERPLDQLRREKSLNRDQLIRSFMEIPVRETTALIHAISLLVGDEPIAARMRRELAWRKHRLPAWVGELPDAEVTATFDMTHILGDGDNVMIEVSWPSGLRMTALVYIDHNMGTVVKDAFPIPDGIDAVLERLEGEFEKDTIVAGLDGAEARARITGAVAEGERYFPPLETETWPGCRPLVEWAARLLPEGGTGYQRPEWTEAAQANLAGRFFASSFGADLVADPDNRHLVDALLWFGCDYGPGDPLRWSPVSVEILMVDWFPRKVVDTPRVLRGLPNILRSFIRFAHAEKGIPADLTAETLDAVSRWEPEYRRAIQHPQPRGSGWLTLPVDAHQWEDERSPEEMMLSRLAEQVGGPDVLDTLDDHPLPDEPFVWSRIPVDIEGEVTKVLELTDRCCEELLDNEYRTITRRLLSRVASGDPEVFRRGARPDYTAGALVWMAGKGSDLFRQITVKSLTEWFGLAGTVSQKAEILRRAAGSARKSGRPGPTSRTRVSSIPGSVAT